MSKKLQEHSIYNDFDINHDGVVTDEELDRSEKMLQIDNMDKLADQQRIMAWLALFLPFILIIYLASSFCPCKRAASLATSVVAAATAAALVASISAMVALILQP